MNHISPQFQLEQDIQTWTKIKGWMETAKEQEMSLRNSIAERIFTGIRLPTGTFPEGTSHAIAEGENWNFKGKLVAKLNRVVLEELLTPTLQEAQLTPEEQATLIKRTPELSLTAYKKLAAEKRLIVDKMIVTKPGAITLELMQLPK